MSTFLKGQVIDLKAMVDYAKGGVVSMQIMKCDVGHLTLFAFDQGQGLSEHSSPFDAMVQVLDGNAKITIDKREYVVNEGKSIFLPANHLHSLYADKPFKMLLTMIKG